MNLRLTQHSPRKAAMASFEQRYPHIVRWVKTQGWIELGNDGMSRSWLRAVDEGGLVWEGGEPTRPLDDVFRELDVALGQWLRGQFGE